MIRRLSIPLLLLLLTAVLSGCDTTRDKSARAKIATERLKIADKQTVVKKPFADVKVERVVLVRGSRRAAVAVRLRSLSSGALSDLPIVVSAGRGGRARALNGKARSPYFDSHVAALAPGRSAWWVLELARVPRGTLSVRVGAPAREQRAGAVVPPVTVTGLRVTQTAASGSKKRRRAASSTLTGSVKNETGFPQYAIPLYAVVKRRGRVVAAGSRVATKFSTNESQTFEINLIGRHGNDPTVTATPAILTPYR